MAEVSKVTSTASILCERPALITMITQMSRGRVTEKPTRLTNQGTYRSMPPSLLGFALHPAFSTFLMGRGMFTMWMTFPMACEFFLLLQDKSVLRVAKGLMAG